jgi:hypothetical protein
MAFASFATALRAWVQHFGWTGAPANAALFGLVALEIRPDEARLDDAALELRRALINNSGADTDAAAREMPVARPSPFAAGPAAASAIISETSARDSDVIIAVTRDAMAAALREAFDAGRADKARELKAMMAVLLDALLSQKRLVVPDRSASRRSMPARRKSPTREPGNRRLKPIRRDRRRPIVCESAKPVPLRASLRAKRSSPD